MIGIDEAGRGAWAGPLVIAGCFIKGKPTYVRELNDSKKLSFHKRLTLEKLIKSSALCHIVIKSPQEVDSKGLTNCIREAILEILSVMPNNELIMLDGKYNFLKNTKYEGRALVEIQADGIYPSVMAASIIAKVRRDKLMEMYAKEYPGYMFERHVGYGTQAHQKALEKLGVSPIHRRSVSPIQRLIRSV